MGRITASAHKIMIVLGTGILVFSMADIYTTTSGVQTNWMPDSAGLGVGAMLIVSGLMRHRQ